jgi:hypothetical protein
MLVEYVLRNRRYFMTPFEERAERIGVMREKARARIRESQGTPSAWTNELLDEYEAQTDDTVRDAIGNDLDSFVKFQQEVTDRINTAFSRGELRPIRCPDCRRVVKTPEARQCLWCGYDWHSA